MREQSASSLALYKAEDEAVDIQPPSQTLSIWIVNSSAKKNRGEVVCLQPS
jgi:hypothetical protein